MLEGDQVPGGQEVSRGGGSDSRWQGRVTPQRGDSRLLLRPRPGRVELPGRPARIEPGLLEQTGPRWAQPRPGYVGASREAKEGPQDERGTVGTSDHRARADGVRQVPGHPRHRGVSTPARPGSHGALCGHRVGPGRRPQRLLTPGGPHRPGSDRSVRTRRERRAPVQGRDLLGEARAGFSRQRGLLRPVGQALHLPPGLPGPA